MQIKANPEDGLALPLNIIYYSKDTSISFSRQFQLACQHLLSLMILITMDDSFFKYLQQLELIAFFAGYPLLYAIISIIAGDKKVMDGQMKIILLLPLSYGIVGLLFLGLQLRNLYPDYSFNHIKETIQNPYLAIWGLLALIFFLPALRKRPIFSLLHSLVFFILVLKPIIEHLLGNGTRSIIKTNMKVYTDSLLLNLGVFVIVLLISFSIHLFKRKRVP